MRAERNAGFTLMELMVVVGIIAILALLAVPGYQEGMIRDQVNAALPLADIAKAPVAASWGLSQSFPADNAAAGLPAADKIVNNYVSAVLVQNGAIHVSFGNRANALIKGKTLSIRPAVVEEAPVVPVAWVCGNAEVPGKMTAKGENRTDVAANHLPLICRALNSANQAHAAAGGTGRGPQRRAGGAILHSALRQGEAAPLPPGRGDPAGFRGSL